jgi:hypothetical protein
MFPARSPTSAVRAEPAPDHGITVIRRHRMTRLFFVFLPAGNAPAVPCATHEPGVYELTQVSRLHAIDAQPAAVTAVPGTWPSCAPEPRMGSLGTSSEIRGSEGSAFGTNGIGLHSIPTQFGRDRRYGKNQRGRAVACA